VKRCEDPARRAAERRAPRSSGRRAAPPPASSGRCAARPNTVLLGVRVQRRPTIPWRGGQLGNGFACPERHGAAPTSPGAGLPSGDCCLTRSRRQIDSWRRLRRLCLRCRVPEAVVVYGGSWMVVCPIWKVGAPLLRSALCCEVDAFPGGPLCWLAVYEDRSVLTLCAHRACKPRDSAV